MTTIDCRNLACPAPVITVKKALEEQAEVRVLLDDGAPRENVTRFARNRGCQVCEERDGNGWALTISAGEQTVQPAAGAVSGERVVLIASDRLGRRPGRVGTPADEELCPYPAGDKRPACAHVVPQLRRVSYY